jgi:hypothetical protein
MDNNYIFILSIHPSQCVFHCVQFMMFLWGPVRIRLHVFPFSSSRQLTEASCSSAGSSHSKLFDQSHIRPYQRGGGDSGDTLSVTSAGSSGSDLEDVNASFLSDSPDAHERKVRRRKGQGHMGEENTPTREASHHDSCHTHPP